MSEDELEMNLLFGNPITIDSLGSITTPKINEILNIGFSKYNQTVGILCVTSEDIIEMLDVKTEETIEPFDFICANCLNGSEQVQIQIMSVLELLFNDSIVFYGDSFLIGDAKNERILNKSNYNIFIDALKKINCMDSENKNNPTPKNKAEKEMLEKLKELRKKYAKYKNNSETISMTDIISAVCAKHPSINLLNVGNLTIYQLINQYKRIEFIDQYFINIKSLLAGADSKEIKMKHWSSKL